VTLGRRFTRRDFLGLAVISATAAVPAVWQASRGGAAHTTTPAEEAAHRLEHLLADREAAAELGQIWLDRQLRPPTTEQLVRAIVPNMVLEEVADADDARLRAVVATALENDYAAGRVTSVQGWLLADTEARLCAVAVLA
jgi:hypothetical protein